MLLITVQVQMQMQVNAVEGLRMANGDVKQMSFELVSSSGKKCLTIYVCKKNHHKYLTENEFGCLKMAN